MTSASLIPDRRRKYFPLNGGPRPTERERCVGHKGIDAARAVLEETTPPALTEHPAVVPLTPDQIERAHAGIDAARHELDDDGPHVVVPLTPDQIERAHAGIDAARHELDNVDPHIESRSAPVK